MHNEVALIRDCLDTGTPDKLRILLRDSAFPGRLLLLMLSPVARRRR